MRFSTVLCSALVASLATAAFAQTTKGPVKGPENRYFTSLGDILGDLPVDAFIKETRQGGKTIATVLDVCYSVSTSSDRKDRFVIELKADGQKLTGTGETLEDKSPVVVNLTRKPVDKTVTFEGKITIGGKASLVSSPENGDADEEEFQQSQAIDDAIAEAPADFTEVSPQSVAVKIKREGFVDLVKTLKTENVQIALDSIAADCSALRTGAQMLRLHVDPARAGKLVAKLKAAPGVIAAGWISGGYDIDRAVRFAAADWREGEALSRDKFAAAIAAVAAKAMDAKVASSTWNDTTGELTIALKRPNQTVPALVLTDTIEIPVLVGAEKPNASDRLIAWVGVPSTTTRDEASGPHLQFADAASSEDDGSFVEDDHLIKALATELKGQRWNSDDAAWK